ncbi:MAG: arginase family protein [Candidatus Roizmanbacteria bacterium]
MHIHFFKASSRLGLAHIPNKSHEVNIGVEDGPDAVLSPAFLSQLQSNYSMSHFQFSAPESVPKEVFMETLARESDLFTRQINDQLRPDQIQVVLGGDHSVAFCSILALLRRLPAESTFASIHFDSHGDLHLLRTSPSGNFHGMWARALTTGIGEPSIDALVGRHLDPHSITFYGNLDLEDEELKYIHDNHMAVWSKSDIIADPESALSHVRSLVSQYDHIHVSFDIDVFDARLAPATGTPAPDGLDPEHVFPLLEEFAEAKNISVDLVEVNPHKPGAGKTIELAQKVIETLLHI